MAHQVETMFYTREKPWHGLGICVEDALSSRDALKAAGLNWTVIQKTICTEDGLKIPGHKANIRAKDNKILGVVTDRYKVVQNSEAFAFTDSLLSEGVRYETAGSLMEGRSVWLLARLPETYQVSGDDVIPYVLFSNTHDGSGSLKVAMTPIRVVCANTLNLALSETRRIWSTIHVGDIKNKMDEARKTLLLAEHYMSKLQDEGLALSHILLPDKKVLDYIEMLIPLPDNATRQQENNITLLRNDMKLRYFEAPDLIDLPHNGWRFINAVSDFATHAKPLRMTSSYKESMFSKTAEGNALIDKAYALIKAAA